MATPLEAIRDGLVERLGEIRANEPGARLGSDPEALHEMRVAVRRTRALFRTGRGVIEDDTAGLEAWLKALGGVLGEVRDLDVLIERLAGAETVVAALSAERSAARERLLRVLDSHEYRELLAELDRTANALRSNGDASTLDELVDRQAAKLRKAAKGLPKKPSDDELHAFRKRVKRTRYAAELAGNAKLARRAKRLQDVLGEHQDAVFAAGRLREFGEDQLAEREEERQIEARAKWPRVWKRLRRAL